jgi:hypothetical protein
MDSGSARPALAALMFGRDRRACRNARAAAAHAARMDFVASHVAHRQRDGDLSRNGAGVLLRSAPVGCGGRIERARRADISELACGGADVSQGCFGETEASGGCDFSGKAIVAHT